jgi:LysM repeat protein
LLIDGKQKLTVRSDHYFTYHSNTDNFTLTKPPEEQAQTIIDTFLHQHGFDFEYHLETAPEMTGQHYYILPLTPDGFEMTFDYMMPLRFEITVEDIKNFIFSGYSINPEILGTFAILTAEEAFQKALDPNPQPGLMEIFRSANGGGGGGGSGLYKINLTGKRVPMPTPTSQPAIQSGGDGLETIVIQEGDTLGKIASKIGWSAEAIMNLNGLSDPNLYVGQTLLIPIMPELSPEKIEGLRGIVSVILYNRADGSQRVEIGFNDLVHSYMILEGDNLQSLQNYQNRPIDIWGTAQRYNKNGILVADVDRFEIPFPDLNFQVLKGIEKQIEVEEQTVLLFQSDDGKSYVEFNPNCFDAASPDSIAGSGAIGEEILIEALVVPDATFGGYPSVCVSSKAIAIDPKSGKPIEILITADQPYVMEEQFPAPETSAVPTASIEEASLVYYTQNPLYALNNPNADAQHLQPMWRFYGHYSNGDEFEILVQALTEEFLLPEIIPQIPPG